MPHPVPVTLTRELVQGSPAEGQWRAAYSQETNAALDQFLHVSNLLLERVQLNSSHLFRADILYDSTAELDTTSEKEARYEGLKADTVEPSLLSHQPQPPEFEGFQHQRTVVRRLIPRKPQLDKSLEQTCFIYRGNILNEDGTKVREQLVVYRPHCEKEEDIPWYHPKVRALAYLYTQQDDAPASLSVHYLPFPDTPSPIPDRLDRTLLSLLKTMIRLLKYPSPESPPSNTETDDITKIPLTPAKLKDTVLPQHIVQDTYTRLKQTYASDLIAKWVEATEPSKHVFEDLSIAAFLVELWNTMYEKGNFPGFVDIACGNGVLVYILVKEGFQGFGFDARRRKTWEVLGIDEYLREQVCIPKPFLDISPDTAALKSEMDIHDGVFPKDTFIISNHADELTCWTPILSILSCPASPLKFLAIPCCSHSLDGSRRRYTIKDVMSTNGTSSTSAHTNGNGDVPEEQLAAGDLKALRAAKQKGPADDKSMYACLTRKTAALAQELGCGVELTLMRIPSTRNIGIVGNRKQGVGVDLGKLSIQDGSLTDDAETRKVKALVERECVVTGGVEASARTWIEKARKLQEGRGRGKVNWNAHIHSCET